MLIIELSNHVHIESYQILIVVFLYLLEKHKTTTLIVVTILNLNNSKQQSNKGIQIITKLYISNDNFLFKYSNIKETLRRGLYFKTIFKTSKYRIYAKHMLKKLLRYIFL